MKKKTIRDLIGGAFLIATAVLYFWTTAPRWPDESAVAPAMMVEVADTPSTEGV
ncbi:MAG: hypothetical protein IH968_04605 [Gemmatimonadetes bacterium]|nr:hypothetical protein [Gemmatimonadota bacterium]